MTIDICNGVLPRSASLAPSHLRSQINGHRFVFLSRLVSRPAGWLGRWRSVTRTAMDSHHQMSSSIITLWEAGKQIILPKSLTSGFFTTPSPSLLVPLFEEIPNTHFSFLTRSLSLHKKRRCRVHNKLL